MKFALINPNWTFQGSIYFGCREPHLPIEYGYAKALLERDGHEACLVDGHLEGLSLDAIRKRVEDFQPDVTVVTTAPSYLFWRCPPPELRVPIETARRLHPVGGVLVAVGPHGSTTPETALRKLGLDMVVRGEFEEVLPRMARAGSSAWEEIPSIVPAGGRHGGSPGVPHASTLSTLPALHWPQEIIERHSHHHHRFDTQPEGPGAEMETSRGCPYACSFCARENFRDRYRRRPLSVILEELDALIAKGVRYVYFIDEIFLPDAELLNALIARPVASGVQLRIDLWDEAMLALLGAAGCVSIEAGVESISEQGRQQLRKRSRLSVQEITARLIFARKHVPFVQANLVAMGADDFHAVESWRQNLLSHGVWANRPVPLFPYPGSPLYRERWGAPDEWAWERAHEHYLSAHAGFSDIQDQQPLPLPQLESKP